MDDLPSVIRHFREQKKIHFLHIRDVRGEPAKFEEVFHDDGMTNLVDCLRAYRDVGYDGVLRPDHYPKMGDANLAQLAGGAAACLGGATLIAWWRAEAGLGCESIAVAGVLTIGLAYSGYSLSFSSVPAWAYLVAVAAGLAVWVGALPQTRKLGGWKAVTLTTLITLVISGIGVVRAYIAWRADSANDPYF